MGLYVNWTWIKYIRIGQLWARALVDNFHLKKLIVPKENDIYILKIWGNGDVDPQIFNRDYQNPFLTIISFDSINSKKLNPMLYNQ